MARKEKQYHFIYKTTNLLNGKYYYGMHSTNNLNDEYYGSGKRLRYSINKHGKENHIVEVLEFFPDRKTLADREKEIVNLNEIAKENCINLVVGGQGGYISEMGVKKGRKIVNEKYGNKLKEWCSKGGKTTAERHGSPLKKSNNRYKWDGKHHKIESKEKISIAASMRVGEKNSQYGTCWITNGILNKKILKNYSLPEGWILGRYF